MTGEPPWMLAMRAVACPYCGAAAGERCRTSRGGFAYLGHGMRSDAARKRPRDVNALAATIVAEATGEGKNPAAVALGRRGGLRGGPARAAKLTPERRSEIARKAARARWERYIAP